MYEQPLVSVIMPVYNVEKYIEDSVRSVIRQTYEQIELIIVDDGSSDESISKAKKVLAGSQVKYKIIHQENTGQGPARNVGLKVAIGEWVLFLDSDDMISDNGIEHLVSSVTIDVDIVFCDENGISTVKDAIRECQKCNPTYFSNQELQLLFLRREKLVLAPGTLYRKSFLLNHDLYFEPIPWSEDQHFIWRVLYHISGASYLEEPIYQYLHRSGSIMTASKADAIIQSYIPISKLTAYYEDNLDIGQYIVPRWVMGTSHVAAKLLNYGQWKKLLNKIEAKENFRKLISFPDKKVRYASALASTSLLLYYYIMRRR